MKLAVTLFDIAQIDRLIDLGADVLIAGTESTANRLVASFSREELVRIAHRIHQQDKELFVMMNLVVHPGDVDAASSYLDFLVELDVDGIVFGDLAIYELARSKGLVDRLIYHPETLNTNHYDPHFWHRQGIRGIVLAKEITKAEIATIGQDRPFELTMIGHGHLNMFHSRRPLVSHYLEHAAKDPAPYLAKRSLRLIEEVRKESYPIVEDAHGTHIFRERPMASFDAFVDLMDAVDVFVIDGILQTPDEVETALVWYAQLRKQRDPDLGARLQDDHPDHDSGFLYQPTELSKEKEDRS
jgi:putative protease